MRPWTFWDYITDEPANPFGDWYGAQDVHVQAALDVILIDLSQQPEWDGLDEYKALTRDGAPLGELRFRADDCDARGRTIKKRRFRPLGLLRPEHHDFIFFGAAEKELRGLVYTPADAMTQAVKRYRAFIDGRGALRAHSL
jgi:hypothetical protein